MSALREAVRVLAEGRGLFLLESRPNESPSTFWFRIPSHRARLELSAIAMLRDPAAVQYAIDCEVHAVQRTLFHAAIEHIAEHDRDPLDRLKEIEAAARKLADALGPIHGWSTLGQAVAELDQLLRSKPGAASWKRDGYGKDPA